MSAMLESSEAAILDRVFHQNSGRWPREAGEAILSIGFGDSDYERMTYLLEKAKSGETLGGGSRDT
jgi:hypothetical protein